MYYLEFDTGSICVYNTLDEAITAANSNLSVDGNPLPVSIFYFEKPGPNITREHLDKIFIDRFGIRYSDVQKSN